MPEGAEAIVERLLRSFKASVERDTGNGGEIWGRIIRELYQELCEILERGDPCEICDYLYNAPAHKTCGGFIRG